MKFIRFIFYLIIIIIVYFIYGIYNLFKENKKDKLDKENASIIKRMVSRAVGREEVNDYLYNITLREGKTLEEWFLEHVEVVKNGNFNKSQLRTPAFYDKLVKKIEKNEEEYCKFRSKEIREKIKKYIKDIILLENLESSKLIDINNQIENNGWFGIR